MTKAPYSEVASGGAQRPAERNLSAGLQEALRDQVYPMETKIHLSGIRGRELLELFPSWCIPVSVVMLSNAKHPSTVEGKTKRKEFCRKARQSAVWANSVGCFAPPSEALIMTNRSTAPRLPWIYLSENRSRKQRRNHSLNLSVLVLSAALQRKAWSMALQTSFVAISAALTASDSDSMAILCRLL